MGRTARRDALLVPYDGEISKYSGVMLRRNTLSDTGFHGVRKIDVKDGVKFQAVVFDRVRKKSSRHVGLLGTAGMQQPRSRSARRSTATRSCLSIAQGSTARAGLRACARQPCHMSM